MSRRTAESNKAILAAWNKEQELVQEGKGTREWTPKQQQDILEKGKAYDDDGIAFQGQHMKSAEMYPEYQGDPGNIQFLTREEHLEAHNGNWRNPTNWYFNPVTKGKINFGDGPFIPCEPIQLPEPIVQINVSQGNKVAKGLEEKKNEIKIEKQFQTSIEHKGTPMINNQQSKPKLKKGIGNRVRKVVNAVVDFSNCHPVLTNIVKIVGVVGLAAVADVASKSRSSGSGSNSETYNYNPSRENRNSSFDDAYGDVCNDDTSDNDYSAERLSPKEHTVRPHGQHYYKNGERVWIEKDLYSRGGKKDK